MSMRALETAILAEARIITGQKGLRMKDILEWSTGHIELREEEETYRLPDIGVNISIKLKRKEKP
jgi:hypothetical protein